MISFEKIPNKLPVGDACKAQSPWPNLGQGFALNQFYRQYSSAEGWLGEEYLAIWSVGEILEFRTSSSLMYPENYNFFGSNGSGTQFGFIIEDKGVLFISAPDIGDIDDVRVNGSWEDLIRAIENSEYI